MGLECMSATELQMYPNWVYFFHNSAEQVIELSDNATARVCGIPEPLFTTHNIHIDVVFFRKQKKL